MGKLILFIIILGAIYFFFIKKPSVSEKKEKTESKDLVMCDECKTFYPKEEIITKEGKNICRECHANT